MLLASLGLFVVVGIVAGAYYGYSYYKESKKVTPTPVVSPISTVDSNTEITTLVVTTTSETTTTSASLLSKDLLTYPSLLLGKGVDLDGDKLSDKAEAVFGTDASIIDSDQDTFPDGHEVFYLYNPASTSPRKLIDSNLVSEYTNSNYNYKLYYPTSWTLGDIASNKSDVLFTSSDGESVQVKVYSISPTETFDDWFSVYAKGENSMTLSDFTSVFEQKGRSRSDKLVYYFVDGRSVYVIVYVAGLSNAVNYDSVIEMMARSFHTTVNDYVKVWAGDSVSSTVSSTPVVNTTTSTVTSTESSTTSL